MKLNSNCTIIGLITRAQRGEKTGGQSRRFLARAKTGLKAWVGIRGKWTGWQTRDWEGC